ncbi:hypothetical protein QBC45DRAFT_441529 [Copromyces sp. CBS 386.78]|nr:hypothetical protein QBC45DRAFT_441529 [Copromyces sp. CBS 386.78]
MEEQEKHEREEAEKYEGEHKRRFQHGTAMTKVLSSDLRRKHAIKHFIAKIVAGCSTLPAAASPREQHQLGANASARAGAAEQEDNDLLRSAGLPSPAPPPLLTTSAPSPQSTAFPSSFTLTIAPRSFSLGSMACLGRSFAFVRYTNNADAENAIANMDGTTRSITGHGHGHTHSHCHWSAKLAILDLEMRRTPLQDRTNDCDADAENAIANMDGQEQGREVLQDERRLSPHITITMTTDGQTSSWIGDDQRIPRVVWRQPVSGTRHAKPATELQPQQDEGDEVRQSEPS